MRVQTQMSGLLLGGFPKSSGRVPGTDKTQSLIYYGWRYREIKVLVGFETLWQWHGIVSGVECFAIRIAAAHAIYYHRNLAPIPHLYAQEWRVRVFAVNIPFAF